MTDKEIMQQALDALQGLFGIHSDSGGVAVWRLGGSSAVKDAITALRSRLGQPEDEPVAWWDEDGVRLRYSDTQDIARGTPLYMRPQPAAWVGLTPEDYDSMRPRVPYIVNDFSFADVAAIVEAKLKEKNYD
jgi:hypothetical protein